MLPAGNLMGSRHHN